jgi:hypothetical protein
MIVIGMVEMGTSIQLEEMWKPGHFNNWGEVEFIAV